MISKQKIMCFLIFVSFLCLSTGCVGRDIKPEDESVCKKLIPFIEDGKTKKEEVFQKPGFYRTVKTFKTKNSTICIFRLFHSDPFYDLVLIFDENDVVKKHSLIRPWY